MGDKKKGISGAAGSESSQNDTKRIELEVLEKDAKNSVYQLLFQKFDEENVKNDSSDTGN